LSGINGCRICLIRRQRCKPLADSKVLQWANEAKRLKAGELREYITPRRHALLLSVIRQARGQVLDDLTQMLLKLVRKIESKSADRLQEWHVARHHQTDSRRSMPRMAVGSS